MAQFYEAIKRESMLKRKRAAEVIKLERDKKIVSKLEKGDTDPKVDQQKIDTAEKPPQTKALTARLPMRYTVMIEVVIIFILIMVHFKSLDYESQW